jgi:hypothetical protein
VKIKEPTAPSLRGRLPFTTFPLGEKMLTWRGLYTNPPPLTSTNPASETNGEHFRAKGTGFVKVRGLC